VLALSGVRPDFGQLSGSRTLWTSLDCDLAMLAMAQRLLTARA
jgi:hypothetical protein